MKSLTLGGGKPMVAKIVSKNARPMKWSDVCARGFGAFWYFCLLAILLFWCLGILVVTVRAIKGM